MRLSLVSAALHRPQIPQIFRDYPSTLLHKNATLIYCFHLLNRWFKLLDKTGKVDKDRGEVLVDIQFMRNNMTASMFDLSAAGKSRSRLGKLKDKVRGKKKESDSVSSVVPSFTQVLTDSEEEANEDGDLAAGKDEKKNKHKMKSLFSPKSNLQRNMSQSMSVLPGKNSSLSGSQSSCLNESTDGQEQCFNHHFYFLPKSL